MIMPVFQVDAFAERLFEGVPVSVCVLDKGFLPDVVMQRIAAENGLPATTFVVPDGDSLWRIKWFSPLKELELCGYGSLAAAFVAFSYIGKDATMAIFESPSGRHTAYKRQGGLIELDFPRRVPDPTHYSEAIAKAIGSSPREFLRCGDCAMVVFSSESAVRALAPDFKLLAAIPDVQSLIATAPGDDCDFVARSFSPKLGADEASVTGTAHTVLIPFWAKRLDRDALATKQLSARDGQLKCELRGQRAVISGHAVRYLEGFIEL